MSMARAFCFLWPGCSWVLRCFGSHRKHGLHAANWRNSDQGLSAMETIRFTASSLPLMARNGLPPWSLYVCCWGQSGKHMLAWSFSDFDPERTSQSQSRPVVPDRGPDLSRRVAALQALYLFVHLLGFLVELHELRFFGCIVAAQLVEHFADGEFIYFGHRNLLRAIKVRKHRHHPIDAFTLARPERHGLQQTVSAIWQSSPSAFNPAPLKESGCDCDTRP